MGMVAILFYDAEQFEQIDNMPSTEGPKCNLGKIGQAVSDKKMFKDYEIVYMYIAQVLWPHIVSFSQRSLIHFQKMILQHFPHTRVWECKFDLAIERSI